MLQVISIYRNILRDSKNYLFPAPYRRLRRWRIRLLQCHPYHTSSNAAELSLVMPPKIRVGEASHIWKQNWIYLKSNLSSGICDSGQCYDALNFDVASEQS